MRPQSIHVDRGYSDPIEHHRKTEHPRGLASGPTKETVAWEGGVMPLDHSRVFFYDLALLFMPFGHYPKPRQQ